MRFRGKTYDDLGPSAVSEVLMSSIGWKVYCFNSNA